MAKKKQLSCKQTKLAKLHLTRVLARQTEETAAWEPSPSPPYAGPRHLPLSWRQARDGSAGPLAAAYFHVVHELAALRRQLQPDAEPPPKKASLPPGIPEPQQMDLALRQAQKGLKDLYRLLSQG